MSSSHLLRSLCVMAGFGVVAVGVGFAGPLQASAAPLRIYVAGESIERRNCLSEAPFTSSGALNNPSNNDTEQYGWMIPFAEKLKLRRPGLTIEFVGAGPWLAGDDYPYDGAAGCRFYPTPGRTSAMSGSDNEAWIREHGNELRDKQFCYDVAFVSRGGNDKGTDNEPYADTLTQIIDLAVNGSSCNTNPLVYVTGHMPDNEVTAATGDSLFVTRVRNAVNAYQARNASARVRFIDQFTPFKNNTPTTAFPNPNWRSGAGFNMSVIGRDGDGLHPKRFASIYAGEVAANAVNLDELGSGSLSTTTPTAPATTPTTAQPVMTAPVTASPTTPVTSPVSAPSSGSLAAPALISLVGRYNMGSPILRDVWIDPVVGNDANDGTSRVKALRTIAEAWRRIPANQPLTTGYRFLLTRGTYPTEAIPHYWDERVGTFQYPIILQSVDGRGAAVMKRDINSHGLKYFYLIDLSIIPEPAGDALHFDHSDYVLVRGVTLNGGNRQAHETLKANQTKHIYIEDSDISGAYDNAIDFVAVQYGHVLNTKIHNAGDWCIYNKGGSANLRVEGNEIYNCGVGGYLAGQGTGVQYLVAPWIHYEAYDIKFVNNVIHDTGTAGMGVNGGYNILMAHNTLYRVGIGAGGGRADHVFEANFGGRACDQGDDRVNCPAVKALGAWGSNDGEETLIPNKNIFVYNNLFVNPVGTSAPWLIQVAAPRMARAGSGLTGTIYADDNLQFKGNIIWDASNDLGVGDESGCSPSRPTCNPEQLRRDNQINTLQPRFVNAAQGDFRLADVTSPLLNAIPIPSFVGGDRSPSNVPVGELVNGVSVDRSGAVRASGSMIGAYVSGASSVVPPSTSSTTPPATTLPPSPPTTPRPEPTPTEPSTPLSPAVPSADLGLTLFATPYPKVTQHQTVSYRLTVQNRGPATAEGVVVHIPHPTNADVVSVSRPAQGTCSKGTQNVHCQLGAMRSGKILVFTVVYRPHAVGVFSVNGLVVSRTEDVVVTNNRSEVGVTVTPAPMSNLVGRWLSGTQTCRLVRNVERCSFTGRLEVKNTGNKVAKAHRVAVSLSHDGELDVKDALLKSYVVGSIVAGRARVVSVSLPNLPAAFHPAHIFAKVDATNLVGESSESDNLARIEVR